MSDLKRFIDEEMIFIRKYIRDLPQPLLVAFAKEFEGLSKDEIKERQKAIFDMYQLSTNSSSLNIELALNKEVELIFKPSSYIITQQGQVLLLTKGNIALQTHISVLGDTRKEIENKINDWMYAVVTKARGKSSPFGNKLTTAKIVELESLGGYIDTKNAKRILNEYALKPIELLTLAFGIFPERKALRLYLPRLLGLFYYNGTPLHVIQLTNTDSGKTHFGVRCEFAFNYTHFSEFPSAARLIYDARNYAKGAVFTSNGIVIDEIDKVNKQRFEEAYQPLNTGLENGIWRRGVQTSSGTSLEGYRMIPFILFGNLLQGEEPIFVTQENTRDVILQLLDQKTNMNTYSFIERFAICDVVYSKIPISKYLVIRDGTVGCMRDSILRGLVKAIEDRIGNKYVEEDDSISGRYRRHSEAVFNVLTALFEEEPDETLIKAIVKGDKDFDDFLKLAEEERMIETPKEEEAKEIVIDMYKYMEG